MKTTALGLSLTALLALSACEQKPAPAPKATGPAPTAPGAGATTIPATYFVEKEPADAKSVVEVKKSAKVGDDVVLRGRIAGREDPFTAGRAAFMVTDLALAICTDGCETPWDHCCETDKIPANAASVQLVGDDGAVIKADAKGQHGLAPNAEVVILGKVKSLDEAGNMVVDAKQVFVKKA